MKTINILISLFLLGVSVQAQNFKVTYDGKEVTDGQVIQIDNYAEDEYGEITLVLNLSVETTRDLTMTLSKNDENALANTNNDMCWGICTSELETKLLVEQGQISQLHTTYFPGETTGTSRIQYTFKSSSKTDSPLTINVDFVYNGKGTSIGKQPTEKSALTVFQMNGTACFSIQTNAETPCRIAVCNLAGFAVETAHLSGNEEYISKALPKGCYLISLYDDDRIITTRKAMIQ